MNSAASEWLAALVALVVLIPLLPAAVWLSRRGKRPSGGMAATFSALETMLDPARRHVTQAREVRFEERTRGEPPLDDEDEASDQKPLV